MKFIACKDFQAILVRFRVHESANQSKRIRLIRQSTLSDMVFQMQMKFVSNFFIVFSYSFQFLATCRLFLQQAFQLQ